MPYDDRLFKLLGQLDARDLQGIWEVALKCKPEHEDFALGTREWQVACISEEWRAVHGHTMWNIRRGKHEMPWKRILIDVADKLKPGWRWSDYRMEDDHSETQVEAMILRYFDERAKTAWAAMTVEQRAKLATSLDKELADTSSHIGKTVKIASAKSITVASLGSGISAGLLTGAGAVTLAQGAGSFALGGALGGTLYQLGLWLVVRLFGAWTGVQLVASGGAAAVGGALLSAPAAVAFAANAMMSTSYRKTIPATLMLLTAHQLRSLLADLEQP